MRGAVHLCVERLYYNPPPPRYRPGNSEPAPIHRPYDIMSEASKEVEHIVLLKLKKDLSPEQFGELKTAIYNLEKIDGVKYISFGENFTARAQGYTHGIIVRFESKQAGDNYQTHELHVIVLGLLKEALDAEDGPPVLAMDYEVLEH